MWDFNRRSLLFQWIFLPFDIKKVSRELIYRLKRKCYMSQQAAHEVSLYYVNNSICIIPIP